MGRILVGLLLLAAILACDKPQPAPSGAADGGPNAVPLELPPPAEMSHRFPKAHGCLAAQEEEGPPYFGRIRWARPGDGVGGYCLGDHFEDFSHFKHASICEKVRGGAFCRDHGLDLTFDANGWLIQIRLHRDGRVLPRKVPVRENNALGRVSGTSVSTGVPDSQALRELGEPASKRQVRDPELGTLELWHYDGLDVEIDVVDGGRVVGGLVIFPGTGVK